MNEPSSQRFQADAEKDAASARHRVRLPRFITAESVGLGDVVKRITTTVGFKPCSACEQRGARLNHWLRFEV
jgi:hypothetical protein